MNTEMKPPSLKSYLGAVENEMENENTRYELYKNVKNERRDTRKQNYVEMEFFFCTLLQENETRQKRKIKKLKGDVKNK